MVDPIADMINRIKNAQAVSKETVEVPFSKVKFEIGKILERTKFIGKVDLKTKRTRRVIDLTLVYEDGVPKVSGVKRVSRPGQRAYMPALQLGTVMGKRALTIVSTSKGLMTAGEARKLGIGGELICEIW